MSNSNNNTQNDTPQAVRNEFNTFMSLREKGVNKDTALRAADHMRRATNEGGEKGAMTAAAQILVWIGAGLLVIVLAIGLAQYANAAAPAKPATANIIGLPVVSSNCRIKCSSSVPMPTLTPTPVINEPPMPTAGAVSVEVQ